MTIERAIRSFRPVNFAFVMGTGIVAVAALEQGFERIGVGLFWLAVAAYAILSVLVVLRLTLYPRTFLAVITDYDEGLSLLTIPTATCLLGSGGLRFAGSTRVSVWLLALGAALWVVLVYGVFIALTVHARVRPLEERIHGGWLLVTVATQSVAILAALVAPRLASIDRVVLFGSLSLFLLGGALYLVLITLVVYRVVFIGLEPTTIGPPYWINAGAVAITTLAGSTLLASDVEWGLLVQLDSFIRGLTLLFWTTATWWIPMLVALGVWRHLVGDVALPYTRRGYDPSYWSIVFPLGMYTVATHRFAVEAQVAVLAPIPRWFVYVAIVTWVGTFLGLIHVIVTWIRVRSRSASADGTQ